MMNNQEKYRLISVENSKIKLQKASKTLNKLMHNLNITAPQRVLYISGMLLAMQEIQDDDGTIISGLKPDDLKGYRRFSKMDGQIIVDRIREYLTYKGIERVKKELMMSSFNEIAKDQQRDIKTKVSKIVDKMFIEEATPNKQIFYYIYENIYKVIDTVNAHVDVMGEMYSEFLKYALGDGKEAF